MRKSSEVILVATVMLGVGMAPGCYAAGVHEYVPTTNGRPDFVMEVIDLTNNLVKISVVDTHFGGRKIVKMGAGWVASLASSYANNLDILTVTRASANWAAPVYEGFNLENGVTEGNKTTWVLPAKVSMKSNPKSRFFSYILFDDGDYWNAWIDYSDCMAGSSAWTEGMECRVEEFSGTQEGGVVYGAHVIEEKMVTDEERIAAEQAKREEEERLKAEEAERIEKERAEIAEMVAKAAADRAAAEEALKMMEEEKRVAEERLETARAEKVAAEEALRSAAEEKTAAEAKLETAIKEKTAAEAGLRAATEEKAAAERTLRAAAEARNEAERTVAQAKEVLATAEKQQQEAEYKMVEAKKRIEGAEQEIKNLSEKNRETLSKMGIIDQEKRTVESKLRLANLRIEEMAERIEVLNKGGENKDDNKNDGGGSEEGEETNSTQVANNNATGEVKEDVSEEDDVRGAENGNVGASGAVVEWGVQESGGVETANMSSEGKTEEKVDSNEMVLDSDKNEATNTEVTKWTKEVTPERKTEEVEVPKLGAAGVGEGLSRWFWMMIGAVVGIAFTSILYVFRGRRVRNDYDDD